MKKILECLVLILIVISCIITGNPIVKNDQIINITTAIIGIMFGIYMLVKRKEISISKQWIAMLILCFSSVIPLIFNTYVSLYGTVYYIFRYLSIFVLYTIVTYLLKNSETAKNNLKNAIIISGIVLTIFGIDLMTTGISNNFVSEMIGKMADQEIETKIYSLFLYTNTFAIAGSVTYLLSLGEIFKKDFNKIYVSILNLILPAILLTQSRICIIFLVLGLIAYFIFLNKENKYKFIKVLLINSIFALMYTVLFNYFRQNGHMILVWISLLLMMLIATLLTCLLIKNEKINKIIKVKTSIALIIFMVVIFGVLQLFTTPLVLFTGENAVNQVKTQLLNIKPNSDYEVKMELEAISNTENDNYIISLVQLNKYQDEIMRETITVNNCNEELIVNVKTDENVDVILLIIEAKQTNDNTKVIIKSLKLNDKNIVLNYKFLPTDIINKLKNLNFSQKSVWERIAFITDGFDIITNNSLLGLGGDCWRYKQFDNQSYYYYALEMHCYFIQAFMEFGIIGIIAFSFILLITLKNIINIIKEKNNVDLSIGIAFLVLCGHTFLDFDMTFLCIMFIYYVLIAILNENNPKFNLNKVAKIILGILIVCISVILSYFSIVEIYTKETRDKKLANARTYEEKTEAEHLYIKLIPYNEQFKSERAQYLDLYINIKQTELSDTQILEMKREEIELLLQSMDMEKKKLDIISKCVQLLKLTDVKEEQEYVYKKIEEVFSNHRYFANQVCGDYLEMKSLIYDENDIYSQNFIKNQQTIKEKSYDTDRIMKIIKSNIEKDIAYIEDYEKCRISEEKSKEIIENMSFLNN